MGDCIHSRAKYVKRHPLMITKRHSGNKRTSLMSQIVESLPAVQETGFDTWVGKIPWRRKWQPNPVFLPGKSHRQRSLAGYSPCGHIELDMTEQLNNNKAMRSHEKAF